MQRQHTTDKTALQQQIDTLSTEIEGKTARITALEKEVAKYPTHEELNLLRDDVIRLEKQLHTKTLRLADRQRWANIGAEALRTAKETAKASIIHNLRLNPDGYDHLHNADYISRAEAVDAMNNLDAINSIIDSNYASGGYTPQAKSKMRGTNGLG